MGNCGREVAIIGGSGVVFRPGRQEELVDHLFECRVLGNQAGLRVIWGREEVGTGDREPWSEEALDSEC